MKINRHAFSLFFVLIFLLSLVACQSESTSPEPTEVKPTPKEQSTLVVATATSPAVDSSSNPDNTTESSDSSSAEENSDAETTDSSSSEEETTGASETGGAAPDDAASENTDESSGIAVSTNEGDAEEEEESATPTPDPNVTPSATPKVRDNWRAVSGEFHVNYTNGIKEFQYWLFLPEIWWGVFEARQENETFFHVMYTGNPNGAKEVFYIQAVKEDEWEANKAKGEAGIPIARMRGVVVEYGVIGENPYEGEEAELFQELIDSVQEVIDTIEIESRQASY